MQDETRGQTHQRLLDDEAIRAIISLRAYEIYEQRGCAPGCELEDWRQAENEMLPLLVEEELQRDAEPQTASNEEESEKSVLAEEKPVKETSRLLGRNRPASEQHT
ncbi:MAG: DUF2934 domain-containing protein [Acidobacteria bacterium]|jgi:hypothetical protein|nr:DUF2934 domain-containing protein [Acidobacteriota bacterium]